MIPTDYYSRLIIVPIIYHPWQPSVSLGRPPRRAWPPASPARGATSSPNSAGGSASSARGGVVIIAARLKKR